MRKMIFTAYNLVSSTNLKVESFIDEVEIEVENPNNLAVPTSIIITKKDAINLANEILKWAVNKHHFDD